MSSQLLVHVDRGRLVWYCGIFTLKVGVILKQNVGFHLCTPTAYGGYRLWTDSSYAIHAHWFLFEESCRMASLLCGLCAFLHWFLETTVSHIARSLFVMLRSKLQVQPQISSITSRTAPNFPRNSRKKVNPTFWIFNDWQHRAYKLLSFLWASGLSWDHKP